MHFFWGLAGPLGPARLFFLEFFFYIPFACAQERAFSSGNVVTAMKDYARPSDHATASARSSKGWRRFRLRSEDRRTTLVFWPAVVGLACLSLAFVCWVASNVLAQKGSEKLLRFSLILPKLKNSQGERKAEPFRMSEPVPNAVALPKERATPTPVLIPPVVDHPRVPLVETPQFPVGPVPTPEPPRFEPWGVMVSKVDPPPPVVMCHEPVVYLDPCAPQRGESPMKRNWKMLAMYSLMAVTSVTIAPPPIFTQEPAKDNTDELKKAIDRLIKRIDVLEQKPTDEEAIARVMRTELKKLENGTLADIKKNIEQATTDVAAIQAEQRKQKKQLEDQKFLIDLLTGRIDSLEKKLLAGGAAPATATPAVDLKFMEEFRSSMKALQETLAKMGTTTERRSMSPPENGITSAKLGRVLIVNHYPQELLFTINGVGHRLPANSSKLVENVPAGALNYEVFMRGLGIVDRQITTLAAGDTFNLTAR